MISRKTIPAAKPKTVTPVHIGIVGDCRVGKSCLLNRIKNDEYRDKYEATTVINYEQYFDPNEKKLTAVSRH